MNLVVDIETIQCTNSYKLLASDFKLIGANTKPAACGLQLVAEPLYIKRPSTQLHTK